MIETIVAKAAEVAAKTGEIATKTKAASGELKNKSFNPDKRIETLDVKSTDVQKNFDPDKEFAPKHEQSFSAEEFREQMKNEMNWSDKVVDSIKTPEQYEIFKEAKIYEQIVDERVCLVKKIDMDYVDPKTGLTNRELMSKGRSPFDTKTGEKIELHHIGQNYDSPFAELCENSEHGDGNDKILHDKLKESWRNDKDLLNQYNNHDKPNHWKERALEA